MGSFNCCHGKDLDNAKLDFNQVTISQPILQAFQNYMQNHPKIGQIVQKKGYAQGQKYFKNMRMLNKLVEISTPEGTYITQKPQKLEQSPPESTIIKISQPNATQKSGTHTQASSPTQLSNNFVRQGYGIMLYKNNCYYQGEWKNNKKNGSGLFAREDGNYYVGQWKNNFADGKGEYYTESPHYRYTGDWVNGLKNGIGTQQMEDGSTYTGQFKNDEKNGMGKLVYLNGSTYQGQFLKNVIQGHGIFKGKTQTYQGSWKNGRMHGTGKSQWINQKGGIIARYVGQYLDGIKQGFGEYTDSKGNIYKAIWKNGQINERGPVVTERARPQGFF